MNDHSMQNRPETLYARFFARIYDPLLDGFERSFMLYRRRELLREIKGRVLEVGAGTGINFPLYEGEANVLAIEPSGSMLEVAQQRLKREPVRAKVSLLQAGIADDVVAASRPESGWDAIVCTLVLCTVPDPEQAITNIARWLRPGGRLYLMEHIRSTNPVGKAAQQLINPVWKHLGQGCHLTRQTDQLLKDAGFTTVWERYFVRSLRFYQAVMEVRR